MTEIGEAAGHDYPGSGAHYHANTVGHAVAGAGCLQLFIGGPGVRIFFLEAVKQVWHFSVLFSWIMFDVAVMSQ
jgi:hypothetical protein